MESVKLCAESVEATEALPTDGRDSTLQQDTVTADGRSILEDDIEDSWRHQLGELKQRIEELQENYDRSYLEIGRVLIQARDVYKGHGDWIKWLKENAPFSVRHAQRLIRVAEMFDGDDATLVSQLGLTSSKAYILTRVGKRDLDHFLHTSFPDEDKRNLVKDMTKRELELMVTDFLRKKLVAPSHEESISQCRETPKENVEANFRKLKEVLGRTIAFIKDSKSDTRESWISELESLCYAGLEELAQASK